ncbi:hypothetical protein HZ996_02285 [Cryomorphaceae bacterium]|nr:hypothetical protein HZ996_02285 [Cryomorphaceae bacterium]
MDHRWNGLRPKFVILLLSLILGSSWTASAQDLLNRRVSVRYESVVLEDALDNLSQEADFRLSYSPSMVDVDRVITYSAYQERLRVVIRDMVGRDYDVLRRGSFVVIVPAEASPVATQLTIEGQVLDAQTGQALTGATIYRVDELKSVAASTSDGSYALDVETRDSTVWVAISKRNYRDTVIAVNTRDLNALNITLEPDSAQAVAYSPVDSMKLVRWFRPSVDWSFIKNVELDQIKTAQVSFVPGLSTNGRLSGEIVNNFSFNVLAGYTGGTRGFELGGLLNINRYDMYGAQIGGIGNVVGNRTTGVQIGGIYNWTDSLSGVQVGGIFNNVDHALAVQVGGIANIGKDFTGLQIAGITNVTYEEMNGLQIAGIVNQGYGEVKGAQIGLVNVADHLSGFQLGLVNVVDSLKGGAAFGLFTFIRNGIHTLDIQYNEWDQLGVRFVTGTKPLYNIFRLGYRLNGQQPQWAVGYGLGSQWHFTDWAFINFEAVANAMTTNSAWSGNINGMGDFHINLGFEIFDHFSIYGGPVLHTYVTDYLNPETGEYGNLEVPSNTLYEFNDEGIVTRGWLGWNVGVRF